MPTENDTQTPSETPDEGQQDQQQQTTPETGDNGSQQQVTIDDSTRLPETHPLVKTLATQKSALQAKTSELREANARAARVTELENQIKDLPSKESVDALQTRYDRLEAFAQAVGLGKALDSRTFTRDLFESDKDIKTLVTEWQRANPSTTTTALGSGNQSDTGSGKVDPNKLLRAAIGK